MSTWHASAVVDWPETKQVAHEIMLGWQRFYDEQDATDVDDDEPELVDNDPVPTDEEKH